MERTGFDDEHDMFRDAFRTFVEREMVPNREKWEEAGIVDRELFSRAGASGFLAMSVPEQYGGAGVDGPVALHLGHVAHPAQQPVGDAWCAPAATGDLDRPVGVDLGAGDDRGTLDDGPQVVGFVVVQPRHQAESVTQRSGDQTGPGRGADQAEPGQVESDGPCGGALAEHDVELEVLHRRVEHLFDRA